MLGTAQRRFSSVISLREFLPKFPSAVWGRIDFARIDPPFFTFLLRESVMKIGRESLLSVLESISPGLAAKEMTEQSACFVFEGRRVYTFNEEIFCQRDIDLPIHGAVRAKPLLDLLSKLQDDLIEIDQDGGELLIKAKKKKSGIRMESEILLRVDGIDEPDRWKSLHPDFPEAVAIVRSCASKDESLFIMTCIHIHPDFIEASDRFQIARYPMSTGVDESMLVRAESLGKIIGFGMTDVSVTQSWIHFANTEGLKISCRRFLEDYRDMSVFLEPGDVKKLTLSGSVAEAVDKAKIFSADNAGGDHLLISLSDNRMIIEGVGAGAWYKELQEVVYTGPPLKFSISPKLLVEVAQKSSDCGIDDRRLFIDTGKFLYVSCIEKAG